MNNCANCDKNDGLCYTSNPPQYKCTIDGNYHIGSYSCDLLEKNISKAEQIKEQRMSDLIERLDAEARKSFVIKTRGEKWAYQQGVEDTIEYYSELLKKEIVAKRNEELNHIDSLEDHILQNLKEQKNDFS